MATETVTRDFGTPEQRLDVLRRICGLLATDIATVRNVLEAGADSAETAYLSCQALGRLGWIAEHASLVAGEPRAAIGGDANEWLTGGLFSPVGDDGETSHG